MKWHIAKIVKKKLQKLEDKGQFKNQDTKK